MRSTRRLILNLHMYIRRHRSVLVYAKSEVQSDLRRSAGNNEPSCEEPAEENLPERQVARETIDMYRFLDEDSGKKSGNAVITCDEIGCGIVPGGRG